MINNTNNFNTINNSVTLQNEPHFHSPPHQHHHEHSVRFLSFNMFMRPPGIHDHRNDYKDDRLNLFCDLCLKSQQYDILCLQEMFGSLSSRRKRLIKEAQDHGLQYSTHLGEAWKKLKPVDSGLVTISRYPIIDQDFIIYTRSSSVDKLAAKGALSTLLQLPEQVKLLVINTHLQTEYSNYHALLPVQMRQIVELKRFIVNKMAQFPNVPVLLLGDFNIDARESGSDLIQVSGESCAYSIMFKLLSMKTTLKEEEEILMELDRKEKINSELLKTSPVIPLPSPSHHALMYDDWRDLLKEDYGGTHPITAGAGRLDPVRNVYLPLPENFSSPKHIRNFSSMDYAFYYCDRDWKMDHLFLNHLSDVEMLEDKVRFKESTFKLMVVPGSTRVEPFYVENDRFGQLSDHFAVTGKFQIVNKCLYDRCLAMKRYEKMLVNSSSLGIATDLLHKYHEHDPCEEIYHLNLE